ncbi:hypothetical protein AVEN_225819-1 [Araneus ventricosus]|uniref:Uncharacterized protein n=1 Tax=Araneus ventricosus TaxID=182803 RepID=A0A4Y2BB43_ARAVE|nr:hypothetical protein AVEN_225819-1 [Araneus ventricosus]
MEEKLRYVLPMYSKKLLNVWFHSETNEREIDSVVTLSSYVIVVCFGTLDLAFHFVDAILNHPVYTVDSCLTGIGLSGPTPPKRKRRLRPLECAGRPHSSQPFLLYWTRPADLESSQTPVRLLNVDEEAVEQWNNEDWTLECCEVLSDDDIVSRVTCGSEETRNFEECPASDEGNLVTLLKLSHGETLVHTEALLNYLEQEDESTPAKKNDIEKSA